MADGSIRVVTKLDNSKLKQQIKELERELKNIQKEQAKVDAQVDGVMAKYQAEREFDSQFPEEFSHRQDIDARAAKELDPIIAKQEELNQKEQQYLAMLDAAKAKLAEQARIADASKQVDSAVKGDAAMGKVQSQAQYNSLLDATAAKMAAIEAAAGQVAAQTGLTKDQILAANPQYQKLKDTMGMLKANAKDFGNEAQEAGKKTTKAMKQAEKSTKKVGSEVRRGIAGFGKMQLAMMGIMMATRAISAATKEYMATNSKLEGQINTLKSLWGQVLGPVIEWVINLLLKAISAVNAFVHALTGINFIARANEAALNKQAKAAGNASKAQLAGFDEQTKLSDTSGSSGDPVTLLDDSLGNISQKLRDMIEREDWFGAGEYIGQKIMAAIENVDWEGLGEKVGKILGGAASFALGLALQLDPLVFFGKLVDFTNGLVKAITAEIEKLDWYSIGKKIMEFFLKGLVVYLITTDPLVGTLMLLFTPKGQEVLKVATDLIYTLLESLTEAVIGSSTMLGEICLKIIGYMLQINPIEALLGTMFALEPLMAKITSGAFKLIGTILGALLKAVKDLWNTIKTIGLEIWESIKNFFTDSIDWGGTPEEIIAGLKEGIVKALKGIWTWIKENIWYPFRDGFKDAADINSPSGEMEKLGGYLIAGLFNGITNGINKIRTACETIWSTIKSAFSSVGTWFQTTFSNAWQKVKDVFSKGGKIFDGIKEGISSTFKTIVNGLIDGINRVIRVPFNAINGMLNTIRGIEVVGITPFKGLWSYNPLSIPQIPKLKLGGIANNPGRGVPAIIGEAGPEAVLPLSGPQGEAWMDILADKIGGGTITIPINLDGKRIATYVVDIQKKKAFAMNGV